MGSQTDYKIVNWLGFFLQNNRDKDGYVCYSAKTGKVLLNWPQRKIMKYDALNASGLHSLAQFAQIR